MDDAKYRDVPPGEVCRNIQLSQHKKIPLKPVMNMLMNSVSSVCSILANASDKEHADGGEDQGQGSGNTAILFY